MERAFGEPTEDPIFGLWAALALELLARSALASVSPALLAEPDKDHRYLLHALGRGAEKTSRKSIASVQVLQLCSTIFAEFTEEDKNVATAIINRRNEELHSGTAAFIEYPSSKWLAGFHKACKALCKAQGKELADFYGDAEADNAEEMLAAQRTVVKGHVESKIAAHRKVFDAKPKDERDKIAATAQKLAAELAWKGYHKTKCPSCGCWAGIQGDVYGRESVSHEDGEVVVRRPVSPRSLSCSACDLRLMGYAELDSAGLGGRYTRTSHYSPEEYFGLVNPDTTGDDDPGAEYDNE